MEQWEAMEVMKAAHVGGLAMMDRLAQAIVDLKEGRKSEALAAIESAVRFFDGELKIHFDHEERALFPVLGRIIGRAGPIGAMEGEHESLWRCIDEFVESVEDLKAETSVGDADHGASVSRLANHIVWTLRGHINREDTMLFPLAEQTLDAQGKNEVTHNLQMVTQLASRT